LTELGNTAVAADIEERVNQVLAMDADAVAILFNDEGWTWDYVCKVREQLTTLLDEQGIGQGAAIGIALRNRPGTYSALVAVVASRRCVVTLSPIFSDTALIEDITTLQLDAIIAYDDEWERPGLRSAAEGTSAALIRISDERDEPVRLLRRRQETTFQGRLPGIAIEMLSSGTTGKPKRIPLKFDRLTAAMKSGGAAWESQELAPGPALIWTPLVHISGMYFVLDTVCSARPTVLLERFSVANWANAVETFELKVVGLTPAALKMVLDSDTDPERLKSLRVVRSGTAPLNPDLQVAFEERFKIPVMVTYGATEFAGAVAGWSMKDYREYGVVKRGSTGRAFPGVQLRIVNPESGDALKAGDEGVLEVSGGQTTNPGEWLRTTDLAMIDDDHFLWIRGRNDDAIIRGGFKVHPSKVVKTIEEHPAVREAEVTSLPDERLGEVPIAGVVPASGQTVTSDELREWCNERLAKYEVPTDFVIVADLPRTPSLKVDRPALRALVLSHRTSA
jgi:long-chain acyl-CoA synthetase